MLHLIQDPSGPFNPNTLTGTAPPEGAALPAIASYVVVALIVLAVTLSIVLKVWLAEKGSDEKVLTNGDAVSVLGVVLIALLVAPAAVYVYGVVMPAAPRSSALVAALTGNTVTDEVNELREWADDRYGVELTRDEARALTTFTRFSDDPFSQVVTTADGLTLYAVYTTPAGAITIHDGLTTDELDTKDQNVTRQLPLPAASH